MQAGIREHTRHDFIVALDNYSPTRQHFAGYLYRYVAEGDRPECIAIDVYQLKDATQAIYLIDDGASVRAFYVAGWQVSNDVTRVFLHAMPTSPDGRTRPDNGRVIDYSTWQLGPRRAYHVKVDPIPAKLGDAK